MKTNKLLTGLTASTLLIGIAMTGATAVNATTELECTEDQQYLGTMAYGQSDVERGADIAHDETFEGQGLSLDDYDITTDELEDMLTVLITDEYHARAEYEAIEDVYGEQDPFTDLIKAETQHASSLANLFEKYGLDVPEDNQADTVIIPDSLQEAYEIGIAAEIANADLYEDYLSQDLPANVERVLTNLMDASLDNHLTTFEAYASGTEDQLLHDGADEDMQQVNQQIDRGNRR